MSKDTSGPAFPVTLPGGESYQGHLPHDGMTIRDYFAAKALQGMSANPYFDDYDFDTVAEMAYAQADEMLAARVKP
ncbi:hypothetical protein [Pseudomonas putida]|uniref:hypothetical protein n=1 Tax=Pseudomonas putida TaxID=303 RepID=UPI000E0586D6|nr:hypothetical protein [Pseudomonas putida]SUD77842.1 Uncharacterised protein [Pseudomonas putida]SUF22586.1 Uncharacterised protein [Pseudomonas putida]